MAELTGYTDGTQPANKIKDWEFNTHHVQNDLKPGEFINAATTLISAGPPSLEVTNGETLLANGRRRVLDAPLVNQSGIQFYPIGLTEAFNINQSKPLQRLYEIGSYKHYIVPGFTTTDVTLTRVYYNGPGMLRALMAYYTGHLSESDGSPIILNKGYNDVVHFGDFTQVDPELRDSPGYNGFWMNLASDVFNLPFGLLLTFMDTIGRVVGSVFLENGYISNHNLNISAAALVLAENVSLSFEGVKPVRVNIVNESSTALI